MKSAEDTIAQQTEWVQEIKQGNQAAFRHIYDHYRKPFVAWCYTQKDMNMELASELYQMTMMILYNNIINDKIEEVRNDLSQYIIQIGKLKFFETLRQKKKVVHSMSDYIFNHEEDNSLEEKKEKEAKIDVMNQALDQLGESCQKIIRAFYYLKISMVEIAEQYQFKNADTVKNMKYKCIKQLQKLYHSN